MVSLCRYKAVKRLILTTINDVEHVTESHKRVFAAEIAGSIFAETLHRNLEASEDFRVYPEVMEKKGLFSGLFRKK